MIISGGCFDIDSIEHRLSNIGKALLLDEIINNTNKLKYYTKEHSKLTKIQETCNQYKEKLDYIQEMLELLTQDDTELISQIDIQIDILTKNIKKIELLTIFTPEDNQNCFIEITAGSGGIDAQDWALFLCRMYTRWAEISLYKYEVVDFISAEEAGIRSATIRISGSHAYGWLKMERGIHRLVRLSPFNSNNKRHTSFASVWIYPEIRAEEDIIIESKDIKIDTFKASGAGGQHVNKTDSAVRITHIPTKIVTQCQSDRSQHRNKQTAMDMLKAKLQELRDNKLAIERGKLDSQKTSNSWGNQIRSYILHPYQMVKDLRSGYQTSNTKDFLNGKIDDVMYENLVFNANKHHKKL